MKRNIVAIACGLTVTSIVHLAQSILLELQAKGFEIVKKRTRLRTSGSRHDGLID